MTFGISRGVAQDAAGNVQTGVTVEVRRMAPGFPLQPQIYADAEGDVGLSNPFFSASGEFEFYCVGGTYRVTVTKPGFSKQWDDVPVGTAQAADVDAYATAGFTWAPESATSEPPTAGCIRANNADWTLADHVYVNKTTLGGSAVAAWLQALSAGDDLYLATGVGVELGWTVVSVTNQANHIDIRVSAYVGPAGPLSLGDSGFVTLGKGRDGQDGAPGGPVLASSRTALKALNTGVVTTAYLTEAGREGTFVWLTGDYSAQVAADTLEGTFVESNSVAASSGAWGRVYAGPIDIRWFGAPNTGAADASPGIAAALLGGKRHVYVPAGTWRCDSYIRLYADTKLELHPDAVIQHNATDKPLFGNGEMGNASFSSGYNGPGDIYIRGGTFDMALRQAGNNQCQAFAFAHAENIHIDGVTFLNNHQDHFVEYNSIIHGSIRNCVFKNMTTSTPGSRECINIDYSYVGGFPHFGSYDGTVCSDITIEGNTFSGADVAIGTHAYPSAFHSNIRVLNNFIDSMVSQAITARFWYGAIITGNRITNSGVDVVQLAGVWNSLFAGNLIVGGVTADQGVILEASSSIKCADVVIRDNNIENVNGSGVWVYDSTRIKVLNNTVRNVGSRGIRETLSTDCIIEGNAIIGANQSNNSRPGIEVAGSRNLVCDNRVDSTGYTYNHTYALDVLAAAVDTEVRGKGMVAGSAGLLRVNAAASGTLVDLAGAGSPEGVISASVGSRWRRTDGGVGTTIYMKESGGGNTGWSPVSPAIPVTFTPTLLFGGGNTGMTGTFVGRGTRYADRFDFQIEINLSAVGSSTGTATIGGLPFNSVGQAALAVWIVNTYAGLTSNVIARSTNGAATISLRDTTATGSANLDNTNFTGNSTIFVSGSIPLT